MTSARHIFSQRATSRSFGCGLFSPSDGIPPVAPRPDRLAYQLRQSGRPDSLDNSLNDTAKGLPAISGVVVGFAHDPEVMSRSRQ